METGNESLAERLNRDVVESNEIDNNKSIQNINYSDITKENESDEKQELDSKVRSTENHDTITSNKTDENVDEIHEKCDNDNVENAITKGDPINNDNDISNDDKYNKENAVTKDEYTDNDNVIPSIDENDSPSTEDEQVKLDDCADSKGDNEEEFVDLSEDSGSDADYESAEEGEEIQVDKENLKELENALTDEEKEERRNSAQKLKEEGNDLFRCGSYKSAIRIYSRALRTCPLKFSKDRSIMYSNRGACKMRLEDYEESIRDCSKALDLHPVYMKALLRRAELYEKTDKLDEALIDYQKIVELDPSQHAARAACMRLPDQIKERNEKLKEEMMGKLKDLGNMVLRPFGLSTNNFQMKQDANTGGYSVNFVQNTEQK